MTKLHSGRERERSILAVNANVKKLCFTNALSHTRRLFGNYIPFVQNKAHLAKKKKEVALYIVS